ncbi:MAG: transporter substrate-binding domain-containing protein [Pseudomonadota bacterium]
MRSSLRLLAVSVVLSATVTAAPAQDAYNVALDGTFAPHAMPKLGGGIEGFNVDLANIIGERLGVTMKITPAQWSGLLPALQAGTYDFIVAPTTITEERAGNLLFSEGYLDTDFQFVVKAGTEPASALKEFGGKTIAVNKGSVYDSWARGLEDEIGWTVESYGTNADAVQAVMSGRADANVAGNTNSQWVVKKNPQLALSYLHSTGRVWGMPFRKDDVETRNKVEAVIECMKLDGTIAALSEKWFGVTPAEGSAAVTVMQGFGQPGFEGHDATERTPDCG